MADAALTTVRQAVGDDAEGTAAFLVTAVERGASLTPALEDALVAEQSAPIDALLTNTNCLVAVEIETGKIVGLQCVAPVASDSRIGTVKRVVDLDRISAECSSALMETTLLRAKAGGFERRRAAAPRARALA